MKAQDQSMRNSKKDERLTAILGPIYKVGFYIMALGILFDLYTRFNYLAQTDSSGSVLMQSPLEALVLVVACLTVSIMMTRRGVYSDSLRFTEARTFSETGAIASSALIAAIIAVAGTGGRLYSEVVLFGWAEVTWAGDLAMFVVMFLMFGALLLAGSYLTWRSYRTQEDRAAREED